MAWSIRGRCRRTRWRAVSAAAGIAVAAAATPAAAPAAAPRAAAALAGGDSVAEATCRIVERAARADRVPVALLTRLVWTESRFRANVTSPAGAQGIAQFMPGTAAARGLLDPFDPEQAIPKAARLLVDLEHEFGNLGLAAAAYNAGAARVSGWLAGAASLPAETRSYVIAVTGRSAEDWAAERRTATATAAAEPADAMSCLAVTAELRTEDGAASPPVAPWGVQLAGNFSKALALASFERARGRYAGLVGGLRPMVIGTVLRSRGTRPFYRVLAPAATRAAADQVCNAIQSEGGACVALRS